MDPGDLLAMVLQIRSDLKVLQQSCAEAGLEVNGLSFTEAESALDDIEEAIELDTDDVTEDELADMDFSYLEAHDVKGDR